MATKGMIKLSDYDINIIKQNAWLVDTHMDAFNTLLKNCSSFCPRDTWRIQCPETIEPISAMQNHKILHSGTSNDGH